MKKKWLAAGLLVVVVALLVAVPQSEAWGRGRVFVGGGVGPVWWGPPHPWWYYPPYPAYYPPPTVVVEPPPVYVQQTPPPAAVPPAPAPPAASEPSQTAYWYYCPGAQAYYPNVQTCSDAWVKVPPRAP